jgi:hypothetical protein
MCAVREVEPQGSLSNSKLMISDDVDNRRRKSTVKSGITPSTEPETTIKNMIRRTSFDDLAERKRSKENLGRRVSFAGELVESMNSSYTLTPSRKQDMWYNKRELSELHEDLWCLIGNAHGVNEEEESMRGLELYMDSDRSSNSEDCNHILLEHLHSIRRAGIHDDAFDIESLASSLNETSIKIGDMQAAQDSAEAYMIYLETMDPDTVNSSFRTQ